jgi:hypothetical protein
MRLALERSVPLEKRHKLASGDPANWDAAQVFLEAVGSGRFTREIHGTRPTSAASQATTAVERVKTASSDPLCACAHGKKIIRLGVELRRPCDIWLSGHSGSGRIPWVRHMIDWLVEAFKPARFSWFTDEFIHPGEINTV